MELDLLQILRVLRRRWWILLLLTIVASGSAYLNVSRQTPLYEATAVFMVNPGALVGPSEYVTGQDNKRLTETYSELINTQTMRDRVEGVVGGGEIYPSDVSVSTIEDTFLIRITVTHTSPEEAASTANVFVSEFQSYIQERSDTRLQNSRSNVDQQIDFLNEQIALIDSEIVRAPDQEIENLERQRQTYVDMAAQLESDAASISMQTSTTSPFVEPVDEAVPPISQSAPNVVQTTLLGAIVGLLIAVGVVALLEYLDNTIKSQSDIDPIVNAPVLSSIPVDSDAKGKRGDKQLYSLIRSRSNRAEAIRLLRTNLTFASIEKPLRSVVVTSALPEEGKSTVAANLAVATAQSGKTVVLVDADLREPSQSAIFGANGNVGISSLVSGQQTSWQAITQTTYIPGLTLILSGPVPPNPSEMISNIHFRELIQELQEEFDLVVIDSPPIHAASDAMLAASVAEGVLLVIRYGTTRNDALKSAVAQIHHSGARIVGIVLNQVKGSQSSHYGENYHSEAK